MLRLRVTIDLETERVTLASGRDGRRLRPTQTSASDCLNGWDDIALTELNIAEIDAYEATRERSGPDITTL